jgi:hypothetical protein
MCHVGVGRIVGTMSAAGMALLLAASSAYGQQFVVSHLAGPRVGGPGWADGPGSVAQFTFPHQLAVDADGNIYVADFGNKVIRRITPAGVVSTVAGRVGSGGEQDGPASEADFASPQGLVFDSVGNLFVTTGGQTLRKITPGGTVSTVAGLAFTPGLEDGTGTDARFHNPTHLAIDGADNLYVADTGNNCIRKVTPAGVVTTLAGSPTGASGSVDGVGLAARFNRPCGIVSDAAGNLYVSDTGNHTIRQISAADASVTTFAGQAGQVGSADGVGSAARFNNPLGLALDHGGNVYVAAYFNDTVRRIVPDGTVTTVAGLAGQPGAADGTGSAARFNIPIGVVVNGSGLVYVSEWSNHTIRAVTAAGDVTTFAGHAPETGTTDGAGDLARFTVPAGLAVDSSGNTFVVDSMNCTIRKITPARLVSTFAGTPGSCGAADGTGSAAQFDLSLGLAIDASDNLYVADGFNHTIRKVTPAGVVTTIAGVAGQFGSVDGAASVARFRNPRALTVTAAGVIYVADTGNNTIRAIALDGTVSTIAGLAGYVGSADGTGPVARFWSPRGIAESPDGNLYVTDTLNQTIRRVTVAGEVTTIAGHVGLGTTGDGWGTGAFFNVPSALVIDPAGVIYIADTGNNMIRRLAPSGRVRTIAGANDLIIFGHTDGSARQARFAQPQFIAYNPIRNSLVVSEGINNAVRYLEHVQTRDIDEDGKADLIVYRPSTGTWFATESEDNFQEWGYVGWGLTGDVPAGGDFDGDGLAQAAVYHPSTGTWFILGDDVVGWSWFGWGEETDTLVQGDYDGDGATDAAVYRPSTGTWYIRPSSGATPWSVVFGEATDLPVPADYDADGKLDIAVYRPASGTWFILTSMSHYTSWYYRGWGVQAEGDTPVQGGDFDGDGKADLCVFRPASGTWLILESHANYTTWNWFGWGAVDDIPVPADYDGDGVTDAAVFRPSNGTWYVRPSSGATQWSLVFGQTGDIPAWKVR